jgi:hypothetical protein
VCIRGRRPKADGGIVGHLECICCLHVCVERVLSSCMQVHPISVLLLRLLEKSKKKKEKKRKKSDVKRVSIDKI